MSAGRTVSGRNPSAGILALATAVLLAASLAACAGPGPLTSPSPTASTTTPSPLSPPTTAASAALVATGSMTTGRVGSTATLLRDGHVLIAGGRGSSGTLASVELYDPATGTFSVTGSMSTPRVGHTATLLPDGRVLVAGGQSSQGVSSEQLPDSNLASAELYDPKTGTFSPTRPMGTEHAYHTASLLPDGRVLIAGGIGPGALNTAELFDPATGRFTPTGSMTLARSFQVATVLTDGRVLVAGGRDDHGTNLRSAELYDPTSGRFSPTGSMSAARRTAALLADGRVLVLGSAGTTASAEIYDPSNGSFTQTGAMAQPSYFNDAVTLQDGRVLVTGDLAPPELFDPRSGTFESAGATPADPREQAALVLLADGRVLMAGGWAGLGDPLATAALYEPAPATSAAPRPGPKPSGTFYPTGSPKVARGTGATATLLADGRVLLAGGIGAAGNGLASAELFDPVSGTFSLTGSMSTPRGGHTATLLRDGRVLITGGARVPNYGGPPPPTLASAELYDPATGRFSPTGSMRTAREFHTATLLADGRVLVTGGVAYQATLASAEVYDPTTGRFTQTGPMATGRAFHTATLLTDGRVLVAGGEGACSTGCPTTASAELWNPASGTFSATGSLTTGRQMHTATRLQNGRVLVTGGGGPDGQDLASAELYEPDLGRFVAVGSMSAEREAASATLLPNGHVLVAGGSGDASADVFDPAGETFGPAGFMVDVRWGQTATLLSDSRVLVVCGSSVGIASGGLLGSAELYLPSPLPQRPVPSPTTSAAS